MKGSNFEGTALLAAKEGLCYLDQESLAAGSSLIKMLRDEHRRTSQASCKRKA